MHRLIKDQAGGSSVFFVLFLFAFIIVTTLTIEFYHIFTLKEYVDTEISRALNIATDLAILDEYRMAHISKMDTTKAKAEFNSYLRNEMQLNSNLERIEDGKQAYKLIIQSVDIQAEPVKYEAKGIIRTKPILIGKLAPIDVDIPFKQKARNQRYE